MGNSGGLRAVVVGLAWLGSGCTTVLYKGPVRPASEIAVLTTRDTSIRKVDSVVLPGAGAMARYEVLPGRHEVGFALNRITPGLFVTTTQYSRYIIVCVFLKAGHTYRARARIDGDIWVPYVVDETTWKRIPVECDDEDEEDDEDETPVAATRPRARTTAPAPRPKEAETAAADGGAADATPDASLDAGAVAPEPAPAIVAAVPPAVDDDEPSQAALSAASSAVAVSSKAVASDRRPGSGLSMFMGLAFGGQELAKVEKSNGTESTLTAGKGVLLGVGGMVTPLWPTEHVGLGVGLDAAVKYDSLGASNGSVSITRYPVALTLHFLGNVTDGDGYLLVKGGLVRDFGVSFSASGFETLDLQGHVGPTFAIGYYKRSNDYFAWDLTGNFAVMSHSIGGETIDATSFGLNLGFHLNL